jgi:hypothetical protein
MAIASGDRARLEDAIKFAHQHCDLMEQEEDNGCRTALLSLKSMLDKANADGDGAEAKVAAELAEKLTQRSSWLRSEPTPSKVHKALPDPHGFSPTQKKEAVVWQSTVPASPEYSCEVVQEVAKPSVLAIEEGPNKVLEPHDMAGVRAVSELSVAPVAWPWAEFMDGCVGECRVTINKCLDAENGSEAKEGEGAGTSAPAAAWKRQAMRPVVVFALAIIAIVEASHLVQLVALFGSLCCVSPTSNPCPYVLMVYLFHRIKCSCRWESSIRQRSTSNSVGTTPAGKAVTPTSLSFVLACCSAS